MTNYYFTPLEADSPITTQIINSIASGLDRVLTGVSYGDFSWSELTSQPATPAAGYVRLYFTGGTLTVLQSDGTTLSPPQYAVLQQQEASGDGGGAIVVSTWTTRTLNTEVVNPGFVSLDSNEFTVVAGRYIILAQGVTYLSDRNKMRLYRVAPSAGVALYGANAYNEDGQCDSELWAYVDVSESTTYRLEQWVESTLGGDSGMGTPISVEPEVYTTVYLWKV